MTWQSNQFHIHVVWIWRITPLCMLMRHWTDRPTVTVLALLTEKKLLHHFPPFLLPSSFLFWQLDFHRRRQQNHQIAHGTEITLILSHIHTSSRVIHTEPAPVIVQVQVHYPNMIYTYNGGEWDRAPKDTTEVIFHPSVTIVQDWAFLNC